MNMRSYSYRRLILLLLCALTLPGVRLAPAYATALPQPNLSITGSVADINGGTLVANDVLEYTLQIVNTGDDNATLIVLTDSIPSSTSYVSGSMKIDSVAKSDGALDDQAEYSSLSGRVTFRLGTLATSLAGGTLLPGASTTVKFRVRVNSFAASGTSISNQANASYGGTVVVDTHTSLSDSDANAPGSQSNVVFVNTAPPSIQLIHSVSPGGAQPPGADLVYTSVFINTGGAQAQNFAVTEQIPANTLFKVGSATVNLGTTGLGVVIQYSNDSGATFGYTPTSGGGSGPSGYDLNVTHLRFIFTGLLSRVTPNNTGTISFTTRIK